MSDGNAGSLPAGFSHEDVEALFFGAARDGQDDILAQFLEAGADPNRLDGRGYTPLILASYNGHEAASRLLVAGGADPDLSDGKGNTALSGVAFKGDLVLASALIELGATVDAPNHVGRTPLMFAVMFGRTAMVELLLAHRADPHRQDGEGVSAAILAERQNNVALSALLASGARP
ncbi:MAG: ankyrin repeat domain-containing protein [Gluconacetobacter diazotrophicus]|nr:ankyrin repeat domain-containing protein [Gluconacetobacter diazotrophicus]